MATPPTAANTLVFRFFSLSGLNPFYVAANVPCTSLLYKYGFYPLNTKNVNNVTYITIPIIV